MRSALVRVWAVASIAACGPATPDASAPVLLFAGAGTSPGDVAAVGRILDDAQLPYSTATSLQLNAMTSERLKRFRLLIVPGGNFIDMARSLAPETTARVRDAVHSGLNYLGICAGAFLAGDGHGHYNSFALATTQFGFFAAEARGTRKAAVAVSVPDGQAIEHYWEDGPELSGWGDVAGKYPDGTPAIAEGASGAGWVILTGVHPEAPDSWRAGMSFAAPARDANAYAGRLVQAALTRTVLPHY